VTDNSEAQYKGQAKQVQAKVYHTTENVKNKNKKIAD
jgi:uncharacterized protein YjbJ (UPF0337 family)